MAQRAACEWRGSPGSPSSRPFWGAPRRAPVEEGCLSLPGIYDKLQRATHIRVRALGRDGQPFEMDADGLLGVCIQHEMDHLDGKLFVDYLSELKRQLIRRRVEGIGSQIDAEDHHGGSWRHRGARLRCAILNPTRRNVRHRVEFRE